MLPALAERHRPDVIVSQHGCDAHAFDPLAHLNVTTTAMGEAARLVDSLAHLAIRSQLVRTARDVPVIVAVGPEATERRMSQLQSEGCEVLPFAASTRYERMLQLLDELGRS